MIDAPCRIKSFFPDAKFIVSLREPVARALSANAMLRRNCSPHETRHDDWPGCCETAFQSTVEVLEGALNALDSAKKECMDPFIKGGPVAFLSFLWWFLFSCHLLAQVHALGFVVARSMERLPRGEH